VPENLIGSKEIDYIRPTIRGAELAKGQKVGANLRTREELEADLRNGR